VRKRILIGVLIAAVVGASVTALVLTGNAQPSVGIMAGSSLIANIIDDVANGKLGTEALIPPGACPGHYDVKPGDIEALAHSEALFIHIFQRNYENVTGAIEAADNPGLIVTVLNVTGNWMVPAVQAQAVTRIAQALGEIYPGSATHYQGNATERIQAILAYGEEVKDRLEDAGAEGAKVICAEMQAGFVGWAGFNVTATFGRPEDLSPAQMADLIDTARESGAVLIIDNLQSGSTTLGPSLEQDIEAIPVTISNFPGGLEDTETWEDAIDKNVDLLLDALNRWEEQYG
jgi:zinc transport system substrate-binding protein